MLDKVINLYITYTFTTVFVLELLKDLKYFFETYLRQKKIAFTLIRRID